MNQESLYLKIYNDIVSRIIKGQLAAGERLDSEKDIAAQYGVSRITSKKALSMLAENGYITRKIGLGSFVNPISEYEQHLSHDIPVSSGKKFIGVIFEDACDSFGMKIIKAVTFHAKVLGYDTLVHFSLYSQKIEEDSIELLKGKGASGLIILPVMGNVYNRGILQAVVENYPIVTINRNLPGIPASSVSIDHSAASYILTSHLLKHGHKNICYISWIPDISSGLAERLNGYEKAMHEQEMYGSCLTFFLQRFKSADTPLIKNAKVQDVERARLEEFLKQNRQITAIVAGDAELAIFTKEITDKLGRSIPDDISIVCFDEVISQFSDFAITHISQPQEALAIEAVNLLCRHIENRDTSVESIVLQGAFVDGSSVKALNA